MQNFIVGGVPHSGKTTLARVIQLETGISHVSGDALVSSFMNVFPELGITQHGESHAASCEAFRTFLREYLRQLEHEQIAHVLDVYHVEPGALVDLKESHRIVFLGYPDTDPEDKLRSIRTTASASDWTRELSDAELVRLLQRFCAESRELRSQCGELGMAFVDTGKGEPIALDSVWSGLQSGWEPRRSP